MTPAELRSVLRAASLFAFPLDVSARNDEVRRRICIGRSRRQDMILDNPTVSSFHAWLNADLNGNYFVADNASTNGTRVNGEEVQKGRFVDVHPGDRIRFGKVETLFCIPETLWEASRDP
jgi:pSer/pThr/pTyr-binding forkhead associated (FHA) protein